MTQAHNGRLRLFVSNVQDIKNVFYWQSPMMKHMAALLYCEKDQVIDNDAIRYCFDLIKANTSLFSTFRGNAALNVATMLSLTEHREQLLSDALSVYDQLKAAGFRASDFLVVAAYQIAANVGGESRPSVIDRMRAFYDGMKAQHPLLTSSDDYIYAAMLGMSELDVAEGTERLDMLYRTLKTSFFSGNGVQALAQVLLLGGYTDTSMRCILDLRQALRYYGLKMESPFTLPALGVLALLPENPDTIVHDVAETFGFLREQRGFGAWSFTKQELELYAAALTAIDYVEAVKNGLISAALSTSITNILIAQQAATVAVAASTAAAAGASAGG